jgi:hypothetical protein
LVFRTCGGSAPHQTYILSKQIEGLVKYSKLIFYWIKDYLLFNTLNALTISRKAMFLKGRIYNVVNHFIFFYLAEKYLFLIKDNKKL